MTTAPLDDLINVTKPEYPNPCKTILVDDVPTSTDAFGSNSDSGPHARVARAISSLIDESPGGRAIALEGSWGAGKSSVVKMIHSPQDSNNDLAIIVFDAWAHEGDPLRRTFIESLAIFLWEKGWVEKTYWQEKLEELAKRRKIQNTQITPMPTLLGLLIAISVMFVPVGGPITNAAIRNGITIGFDLKPNWLFIGGIFLLLMPMWVLVGNLLYVALNSVLRGKKCSLQDWDIFVRHAVTETKSITTENADPTSIEFDRLFDELISASLSIEKRRLLIVLDNLDRVESDTALSIWSTLQTFLHDRSNKSVGWFQRLWVLVPYDPNRISKLWQTSNEPTAANPSEKQKNTKVEPAPSITQTSESFLDKSFQIRFHVAPPVLSDWKQYLYTLIEHALPGHSADKHDIYRIYEQCMARNQEPPTPRALKLYVNQIGAVHRQWGHEFPLKHVAYFVIKHKSSPSMIYDLRQKILPTKEDIRLIGGPLTQSLAGIAFNVPASKGMELLLRQPIYDALKDEDQDEITALESAHSSGFWSVLELTTSDFPAEECAVLASIAYTIHTSEIFDHHEGPEIAVIRKALKDSFGSPPPLDEKLAERFQKYLSLVDDPEFTKTCLQQFGRKITTPKAKSDDVMSPVEQIKPLLTLLEHALVLEHGSQLPNKISLANSADSWLKACSAIYEGDSQGRFWNLFSFSAKQDTIVPFLDSQITANSLTDQHHIALKVTLRTQSNIDWTTAISNINARLHYQQGTPIIQVSQQLNCLMEFNNNAEFLKPLASNSSLLHHLHSAHSASDTKTQAAFIATFMIHQPTLSPPQPSQGQSAAGYNRLKELLKSPDETITTETFEFTRRFNLTADLCRSILQVQTAYPFIADLLKKAAQQPDATELITSELYLDQWIRLIDHLETDDIIDPLTKKLIDHCSLCETICTNGPYNYKIDQMYARVLKNSGETKPVFRDWCAEGLRSMSKESWGIDLKQDFFSSCELCLCLIDLGIALQLPSDFSDALLEHARQLLTGNDIPPDQLQSQWCKLLSCIDTSVRAGFEERLIDLVVDADGEIHAVVFKLYGRILANPKLLSKNAKTISHFFTAVLRRSNLEGLVWLDSFAASNKDFLAGVNATHVTEFRTRLIERFLKAPKDEEFHLVDSITSKFGIEIPEEQIQQDEPS